MSEIGDLIRKLADIEVRLPEVCKVVSVSRANTEYVIDVVRYYDPEYRTGINENDRLITDVRLNPLQSGNYAIPAEGSFVLVVWDEQDIPYMIMAQNISNQTTVVDNTLYSSGKDVVIEGTDNLSLKSNEFSLETTNFKITNDETSIKSNKIILKNDATDLKTIINDTLNLLSNVMRTAGSISGPTTVNPLTGSISQYSTELESIRSNLNSLM